MTAGPGTHLSIGSALDGMTHAVTALVPLGYGFFPEIFMSVEQSDGMAGAFGGPERGRDTPTPTHTHTTPGHTPRGRGRNGAKWRGDGIKCGNRGAELTAGAAGEDPDRAVDVSVAQRAAHCRARRGHRRPRGVAIVRARLEGTTAVDVVTVNCDPKAEHNCHRRCRCSVPSCARLRPARARSIDHSECTVIYN